MVANLEKPDYERAQAEALRILEACGVIEPPVDLLKIAEDYGIAIKLVQLSEKYSYVSGFYDAKKDAIFVNSEEFPRRQIFTIAHELGHRFLHKEWAESNEYQILLREQLDQPSDEWHEKEANYFAANLLVPKFMLDDMLNKYKSVSVDSLATVFCVSRPMLTYRLKHLYEKSKKIA